MYKMTYILTTTWIIKNVLTSDETCETCAYKLNYLMSIEQSEERLTLGCCSRKFYNNRIFGNVNYIRSENICNRDNILSLGRIRFNLDKNELSAYRLARLKLHYICLLYTSDAADE